MSRLGSHFFLSSSSPLSSFLLSCQHHLFVHLRIVDPTHCTVFSSPVFLHYYIYYISTYVRHGRGRSRLTSLSSTSTRPTHSFSSPFLSIHIVLLISSTSLSSLLSLIPVRCGGGGRGIARAHSVPPFIFRIHQPLSSFGKCLFLCLHHLSGLSFGGRKRPFLAYPPPSALAVSCVHYPLHHLHRAMEALHIRCCNFCPVVFYHPEQLHCSILSCIEVMQFQLSCTSIVKGSSVDESSRRGEPAWPTSIKLYTFFQFSSISICSTHHTRSDQCN
mmetsp:Transcript_16402/g.41622  ORF Transcript_16402/g.41622 Transcript_16402/m.41622 type:complete len:274 (-) Transcript_16402:247-1068(-)